MKISLTDDFDVAVAFLNPRRQRDGDPRFDWRARGRSGEDDLRRSRMVQGALQVLLVGAKGLDDADFFGKMDPYAVLICRSQEHKSSIASGAGNEPEWNETFMFTVSDSTTDLTIKLFDKDTFSSDDFVGEAKIPLDTVFAEGNLPPTVYNVVKDQEYRGEIKVGLTFTPSENRSLDFGEEEFGGWKQSSLQ